MRSTTLWVTEIFEELYNLMIPLVEDYSLWNNLIPNDKDYFIALVNWLLSHQNTFYYSVEETILLNNAISILNQVHQ